MMTQRIDTAVLQTIRPSSPLSAQSSQKSEFWYAEVFFQYVLVINSALLERPSGTHLSDRLQNGSLIRKKRGPARIRKGHAGSCKTRKYRWID